MDHSDPDNESELKIADFGLATIIDPNVVETYKCGSPGYVAPEMLNDLGYGAKADIFSAGIIFCIMLTGLSPFYDTSREGMLQRNQEGIVNFSLPCWNYVSKEAKDLASKMVAKDPIDRYTASEALQHPWFCLEHNDFISLANAQENMAKYRAKNRFDVSKIKPEFSMVTCTPLLCSQYSGVGSPLLVPLSDNQSNWQTGILGGIVRCRTPNLANNTFGLTNQYSLARDKVINLISTNNQENYAENFNAQEMDEKFADEEISLEPTIKRFFSRVPPPTPGFTAKKSLTYLKYMTPVSIRRPFRSNDKEHYLYKIAFTRLNEENKMRSFPYPIENDRFQQINFNKIRSQNNEFTSFHKDKHDKSPIENLQKKMSNGPSPKKVLAIKLLSKRLIESSVDSISSSNCTLNLKNGQNLIEENIV